MRLGLTLVATLAAGGVAAPAAAQTRTAEFTIGGVVLQMPLPDGFCTPQGIGTQVAQIVAAADRDNVTNLTLFPCDDQSGTAPDYYLVKTPAALFSTPMSRDALLATLRVEFNKPEFKEMLRANKPMDKAAKAYSELLHQKTEVTGTVEPMGLDETCGYMGGLVTFASEQTSYTRAVSGCVSAVEDRVVIVFRYSKGEPGNVPGHMRDAKALIAAMRVKK